MLESEFEKYARSPEGLFKGDYINAFLGLDFNLRDLKSGHITQDYFIDLYKNRFTGNPVLKFSERYKDTPIPQMYAEKIKKLDALIDEITPLFNKFLVSKDDNDRNKLIELTEKGIKEIKS